MAGLCKNSCVEMYQGNPSSYQVIPQAVMPGGSGENRGLPSMQPGTTALDYVTLDKS